MSMDEAERAELELLRVANRLTGVATWNIELAGGELTNARLGVGTTVFESLGYSGADAPAELGPGFALAIQSDDRERVLAALQACIDGTTEQLEVEYRARHKDGSIRWKLGRGVVLRDDAGRPIRIAGTSVELTRLKQVEEDARVANERLELAAELLGFAVTEYDLRGAADVDQAMAKIQSNISGQRQWPPTSASEINFRESLVPEDVPRAVAAIRASVHGEGPALNLEYRTRNPGDGTVRWRLGRGKCYYDVGGAPIRYIGASVDIQQLKDAQEETRRVVEQLEMATLLSGVSVWSVVPGGKDLGSAKIDRGRAWQLLGYESSDVPPEADAHARTLVTPEDNQRVRADLQACIDGEIDHIDVQCRVRHKDGSRRWHLVRGVPIRNDDGQVTRVTGTSVDITRLKQVEDELRAAKDRLDLAAELVGFTITELDLREPVNRETAIHDAIVPEDLPRAVERFLALLHPGSAESSYPTLEFRTRSADGSVRWRAGHGKCFFDEAGAPVRFLSVTYDIENIKAAEQAAKRVTEQLQLTTQLSGVNVWSYDLRGDPDLTHATVRPNESSVLASLGHDRFPSTLHARLLAVVHPDDQDRVSAAATDCITGKTPMLDTECRFVGKNGSVHWKLVRGVVERDADGRPLLVAGTVVDIAQIKQVQEELRRVRERLELAIMGSNACTWDFEIADGDFTTATVSFTNAWELAGYEVPDDPAQIASVTALTMLPEDLGPHFAKVQAFIDGTEREWETELRIMHKDGTVRHHLSRGVLERDATGRATRFTGTNIDVTASKNAEKRLLESEERFRRTFENAAVGMILTNVEGRILEYNARFCAFLGYSREELAGRNFVELMVPGEVADDLERQRSVVRGDIASFTRDKRYIRKDGAIVWGNITVSVIQRHADGTPVHVMGILQDITERKSLEVEVEQAQKRIELALRGSDIAVFHGDFVGPDPATAEWTYFNMWEPLGFDADPGEFEERKGLAIHPDDQAALVEKFAAAVQTRSRDWHIEHRVLHRDGSVLWRLSRGTLIYDETGAMKSLLGTEVDITDLKKIESELERARETAESANRAKDEFLANVSHEIRTPMNAILGMTELAIDAAPSDHQRQLLSTVRSAAKNLLTIINDLLDFSKIASGKLTLDSADFSLRATVGETLRALAVRAHRKGLELLCHVRSDVPDALAGDAGRLRQVLMNLVGNAIKFTQQGEIEVSVEAEPAAESSVAVVFKIRDTGIGIASDKQATIFRAFEQEDSSTTRKYGGTGLGLTISAQLASIMGGDITVQSVPGQGSTFRFAARFALRPATPVVSPERLAQLRVLVVDDNEANRRILGEWLTSWRMLPTAVSDAAGALAALARAVSERAPFSVVLLDEHMPDTDGVALAAEIRRRWEAQAPRLILLSSDGQGALSPLARDRGVLACLLKPVQQSELLEAISAVINLDIPVPGAALGASGQRGPSRSLRVLVAEDNDLNITLLKALLSTRHHVAQFARDGRAAVALAAQGGFDLMLLDLHMPELDGFEVVQAIRDHERATGGHLRIVALTARSSTRDRERCLAAGMDDFLAKPIEAAALWELVERVVAQAPNPQPAPPDLLDPSAILRACGRNGAVLEKLVATFRRTLPVQMSRIRAVLTSGDLESLREAAHQLVATVGAFSTITASVASTLEVAASHADRASCAALVGQLEAQCGALVQATVALSIDGLVS